MVSHSRSTVAPNHENVKFSDATEARTDIIKYKGGMEFTFSSDDDQISRLLVRSFYPIRNIIHPENRVSLNRRRYACISSQHVMTKKLISYEIIFHV